MKNSNDAIGNRTRDLPACSAVPQPTAPLRAPLYYEYDLKMLKSVCAASINMKTDEDREAEKYCINPNTRGSRVGRGHLIIACEV